jgi:hypothetical protein
MSFELVPIAQALRNPVGEGRSEPNVDPHLPEPTGRFKWTWNPVKLAARMIGPELKFKILCAMCLLCCCMLIVLLFPLVFTDAVSAILFS